MPLVIFLLAAADLGMVVCAPLMAAISRSWSPCLALSSFLLIFIAMHLIGVLTDSFGLLLSTRIVAALTNAGFLAVTFRGTPLALIVGVPAGASVGALHNWRAALRGVAIISGPGLIAVVLSTPARATSHTKSTVSLMTELRVLRRLVLLAPLALCALVNAATSCAFTYLAPLVAASASLQMGYVLVILCAFGIGSFMGVWVAGRFGDDYAPRILVVGGANRRQCSAHIGGWRQAAPSRG